MIQKWEQGKFIANRYRIRKPLGGGNFTITYLAWDEKTNKEVVIKTLRPDILNQFTEAETRKLKDKVWQESVNLAKCKHENIVPFIDVLIEQETDLVCIIMKYIDGETLDSYSNQRVWPQKIALKYIKQIGEALKCLHEHDIIHRNVKPSNIILQYGKPRKAILTGFSLARVFKHPVTQMNSSSADGFTPSELFSQEDRGPFTDIYSLSATLYFLITKEEPPTVIQRSLSLRKSNKDSGYFKEPKEIIEVNERINNAIIRGMAIDPTKRPQSIQEWFELLGVRNYLPKPWREKWNTFVNKPSSGIIIGIVSIVVGLAGIIISILLL